MLFATVFFALFFFVPSAFAVSAAIMPTGNCTNQPQFNIPENSTILADIANEVYLNIRGVTRTILRGISSHSEGFVDPMIKLYIVVYGVLFMFGAVQVTLYEFVTRLAKVSIVAMTLNGGEKIYSLLTNVFENGTNDLVNKVGCLLAESGCDLTPAFLPLSAMDNLLVQIISPKMVVTLLAIATSGIYGPIIAIVLVIALKSLLEALLNALWVFLMSAIVRAILYALAPLFIPCVLFSRTRDMFQGWLNQLIGASLQPVMMISFFAFFIGLLKDSVSGIINARTICMVPRSDLANGTPLNTVWWNFTKLMTDGTEQLNDKIWGFDPATGINVADFPINLFNVFILFVLAELVRRFNETVIGLSNAISHAATSPPALGGMISNSFESIVSGFGPSLSGGGQRSSGAPAKEQAKAEATTNVGRRSDGPAPLTQQDAGAKPGEKPADTKGEQTKKLTQTERALEMLRKMQQQARKKPPQ